MRFFLSFCVLGIDHSQGLESFIFGFKKVEHAWLIPYSALSAVLGSTTVWKEIP